MQAGSTAEPEVGLESLFRLRDNRFARIAHSAKLAREARLMSGRVALLSPLVTWLPLLLLVLLEDALQPQHRLGAFLHDLLPHGRYLLAVPVMIAAESFVGPRLQSAILQFRSCGILTPTQIPALQQIVLDLLNLWRSPAVNVVVISAAFVATYVEHVLNPTGSSGNWEFVGGHASWAGIWQVAISQPLMRFVIYRWLFRLLLWGRVLWRIASLPLSLIPEHPDRCGGLAFLGAAQSSFAFFAFANGVQICAGLADNVLHGGSDLKGYYPLIAAFTVLCIVIVFGPLAAFAAPMAAAQREAQLRVSRWIGQAARFTRNRLEAASDSELAEDLKSVEISSVADAGGVFENIKTMLPLPIQRRHLMVVAIAALAPFSPLLLLVMSMRDIMTRLAAVVL